jgi:AAA+ superfamily predicted ATPase
VTQYLRIDGGKAYDNDTDEEVSLTDIVSFMNNPSQWAIGPGGIMKVQDTHMALRTGNFYYKVVRTNMGRFLKTFELNTDEILDLSQEAMVEAVKEMNFFIDQQKAYKDFGVIHKRGFLLHGPPGNGKSALIARLSRHLGRDRNTITLLAGDVHETVWAVNEIRSVEPKRPIMVIFEEIDSYQDDEDTLLTFLDGEQSQEHLLFLATTNHYRNLSARLKRTGRFDVHVEVKNPSQIVRYEYLSSKLKTEPDKLLQDLAERTKGFSLARLKELCVLNRCLNVSFEDGMKRLTKTEPDNDEEEGE